MKNQRNRILTSSTVGDILRAQVVHFRPARWHTFPPPFTGREIYREKRLLNIPVEGYYDCWLGQGQVTGAPGCFAELKIDEFLPINYSEEPNNFNSRAIDLKCFWEVCGDNCNKCQSASAQLLNINLLTSKDLTVDEYLYGTTKANWKRIQLFGSFTFFSYNFWYRSSMQL